MLKSCVVHARRTCAHESDDILRCVVTIGIDHARRRMTAQRKCCTVFRSVPVVRLAFSPQSIVPRTGVRPFIPTIAARVGAHVRAAQPNGRRPVPVWFNECCATFSHRHAVNHPMFAFAMHRRQIAAMLLTVTARLCPRHLTVS